MWEKDLYMIVHCVTAYDSLKSILSLVCEVMKTKDNRIWKKGLISGFKVAQKAKFTVEVYSTTMHLSECVSKTIQLNPCKASWRPQPVMYMLCFNIWSTSDFGHVIGFLKRACCFANVSLNQAHSSSKRLNHVKQTPVWPYYCDPYLLDSSLTTCFTRHMVCFSNHSYIPPSLVTACRSCVHKCVSNMFLHLPPTVKKQD